MEDGMKIGTTPGLGGSVGKRKPSQKPKQPRDRKPTRVQPILLDGPLVRELWAIADLLRTTPEELVARVVKASFDDWVEHGRRSRPAD